MFQRRLDGSVDFYRGWSDYKNGFGSTSGEFWLGNDNIHSLTSIGSHILRIDMETFDGDTRLVEYTDFSFDSESTYYALRFGAYLDSSTGGKCSYREMCVIKTDNLVCDFVLAHECTCACVRAYVRE